MLRALSVFVLTTTLLAGCLLRNTGPTKKLTDTVYELDKAARWGQLGQASALVEPTYRARFVQTHQHWGQLIQLADSEVMQIDIAPDQETAIAIVAYSWYHQSAMTLHQSLVRQRWSSLGGGYALVSEAVVRGDGRLFDPDGPTDVGGGPTTQDPGMLSDQGISLGY